LQLGVDVNSHFSGGPFHERFELILKRENERGILYGTEPELTRRE